MRCDRQLPVKVRRAESRRKKGEGRYDTSVHLRGHTKENELLGASAIDVRPLCAVSTCQRARERQREALPAERCPRCHGLVWEVTDSACVSVWRGNKTAEKSRGRSLWPFVLPGSISLCASDNNFKGPRLPEPLTGVCVCVCGICGCVHQLWKALTRLYVC